MTHETLRSEPLIDAFTTSVKRATEKIRRAYSNYRSDRAGGRRFCRLSDHLLTDIGITRFEAEELDLRKRIATGEVVTSKDIDELLLDLKNRSASKTAS